MNFNTSHVNVNQLKWFTLFKIHIHFNTSHVNVNPCTFCFSTSFIRISIHLMLMLILIPAILQGLVVHFNTSHVNVNHGADGSGKTTTAIFQYISC